VDKLTVSELLDGVIQDYKLSGNRSIKISGIGSPL